MIFSILALLMLIISICIKDRKKSLNVQSLNCFFEFIYNIIINAYTAITLSLINIIRSQTFIRKEKINKKIYMLLIFIFELIIVINCTLTWTGNISLLPTVGTMFRTYCLWQSDMKLVRISGITTGISYGVYYMCYEAWFMVLGYTILTLVALYSCYKNDIKVTKKADELKQLESY